MDIQIFLLGCLTTLYFILPAYFSNGGITGVIQGLVAPSILSAIGPYIITPIITDVHSGIIIGFLLGFGALVGDALGSFLKRRLGIGRGKPAPFLDQLDFIIVALIFVSPVVKLDPLFILIAIMH